MSGVVYSTGWGITAAVIILFILVILIIIGIGAILFWFGVNRFEALGFTVISSANSSVSVLGNQQIIYNPGATGTTTLTLNSDPGNTTGKVFIITNLSGSTVSITTGTVSIQNAPGSSSTVVSLSNRDSAYFVFNTTNAALFVGYLHNS